MKALILFICAISVAVVGLHVRNGLAVDKNCLSLPPAPSGAEYWLTPNPQLTAFCGFKGSQADVNTAITCPKGHVPAQVFTDYLGAFVYSCPALGSPEADWYWRQELSDPSLSIRLQVPQNFFSRKLMKDTIGFEGKWRIMVVKPAVL